MSYVTVCGGATVDGGPCLPGELRIVQEVVDVSTNLPKPDPNWSTVDAAGHFHAYDATGRAGRYPTLRDRSRHHDCDGSCSGMCGGEGWGETYFECRICGVEIEPGSIPGPHYVTSPGLSRWEVELTVDAPPDHGKQVLLRVFAGDREHFGVAQFFGEMSMSSGDPGVRVLFVGVGPLGSRPSRVSR